MSAFLRRAGRTVALYVLVVPGGTIVFLLTAAFIGYAPFSDRPGPGWYGWRGTLSSSEIQFFAGWSVFLLPPAVVVSAALALTAELFQWVGSPRWVVAASGALLSGVLSLLIVAAAGWMIAIGSVAILVAGVLGIVFGGLILPRSAGRPETGAGLGTGGRVFVVALWLLSIGLIVFPFLPERWTNPGYGIRVSLIQLTHGAEDLNAVSGLTAADVAMLAAGGVRGRLRESASFSGCSGNGCRRHDHPHVIVVLERPVDRDVVLAEPAPGGRVIYVQRGREWIRLPAAATLSKRTVSLRPGEAKDTFMYRIEGRGWQSVPWLP